MENEIEKKEPDINVNSIMAVGISPEKQLEYNQRYITDLFKIIKTNSTIPTHTPKKLLDCIYLYYDGDVTYELYLYINNLWKKVTLE